LRRMEAGAIEGVGVAEPVGGQKDAAENGEVDPWDLRGAPAPRPMRRLHPACDDKMPLYVQDQGARVGLDGDCLVVRGRESPTATARLPHTSHVVLYGNVQVSAQAMRALLERSIPVSFLSYGGWYYGRATGVESKNVELRMAQHRAAAEPAVCL